MLFIIVGVIFAIIVMASPVTKGEDGNDAGVMVRRAILASVIGGPLIAAGLYRLGEAANALY